MDSEFMSKIIPLNTAIKSHIKDGQTIALEGFTHLIPFAAGHEIIRQKRKDLTLIRMTPDIIYDQLIGMGCVKKVIFSYAGNPGVGLLRRMRDAIENQWPNAIETQEHSHAAMANAYEAGASGLPLAVFRGYRGADLPKVNDTIKHIDCPYTGERLATVPALAPDVTIIHAQKATQRGDVLIEGIIGVQKEAALAARTTIVTVEEVVENFDDLHPNLCILPHWTINAVCVVPGGAHPSYAHGYYGRDNAAYLEWNEISSDRDLFKKWMAEHVMGQTQEVFKTRVAVLRDKP